MRKKNRQRLVLRQTQRTTLRWKVIAPAFAALGGAVYLLISLFGNNQSAYAVTGKDGAKTINSANVIINEFERLTANASAGATTITVSSSTLNANSRFTSSLSAGDLILIIQMQGASIYTGNDASYGSVTAYNSSGLFEFAIVQSIPSGTSITLESGLKNTYSSTGRTQIVRVPRYTTLTVTSSGSISTDSWNGNKGGIITAEVLGEITIDGSVNATGKGFRGGVVDDYSYTKGDYYMYRSSDIYYGGEKGESIAGFQGRYTNGRYGRGAPANGGGGGNAHNASGGGGANGGDPLTWDGIGNPDNSSSDLITAWNLESESFSDHTSSGGGRGGYAWSEADGNPLTDAPCTEAWKGDWRCIYGGYGGRPLDHSTSRIFFGGGGGAGDSDEKEGTSGAAGGGLVYLMSKSNISGTGTIYASGNRAVASGPNVHDGAGGGGGGGTVVLYSQSGSISNISIVARGGDGGSQDYTATSDANGPGGGGGGGYVALSTNTGVTIDINGGSSGSTNSPGMSSFTANGATKGGAGESNGTPVSNPYSGSNALPVVLTSFNATQKEKDVLITWSTESEKENDFFTIQRSADGETFNDLAKVRGAGTCATPKSYLYTDKFPLENKSYYRLKQTDYNGDTETFGIKAIDFSTSSAKLHIEKIVPNPFTTQFTATLTSTEEKIINLRLYASDGKLVVNKKVELNAGSNNIDIFLEDEKPGFYILKIIDNEYISASMKVIKK